MHSGQKKTILNTTYLPNNLEDKLYLILSFYDRNALLFLFY